MKTKHLLRMAIKDVSSDGSFEGSLAVYNNVDLGGDLIVALQDPNRVLLES